MKDMKVRVCHRTFTEVIESGLRGSRRLFTERSEALNDLHQFQLDSIEKKHRSSSTIRMGAGSDGTCDRVSHSPSICLGEILSAVAICLFLRL
jgi:hypothetical protein